MQLDRAGGAVARCGACALAAVRDPFMVAFHLVGDRPPVAVGTRTIDEALPDQPAGERVELRNAARPGDSAAAHAPVRLHPEQDADGSAYSRVAQIPWVIPRRDLACDLLELCPAAITAITEPARTAAGASAKRRTGASATP